MSAKGQAMAKPLATVKMKNKDGSMLSETWRDGSVHEVKLASFLTIMQGDDGRPPYVLLAESVKAALTKGGFDLDSMWLNAFIEDGSQGRPSARAGAAPKARKAAPVADPFGEDD